MPPDFSGVLQVLLYTFKVIAMVTLIVAVSLALLCIIMALLHGDE
jgi:hypothetical protein